MSSEVLVPPGDAFGTTVAHSGTHIDAAGTRAGPALHRRKRVFALDVLRGIAILLVLPHHAIPQSGDLGWMNHVSKFFERFGWTGVDLFFVLSGFLIGGLLFREVKQTGRLNARRFLTRRALKLWPAYFALLAFAAVKEIRHHNFHFSKLWPSLLQIQNYGAMLCGHTWSLAIEEHFYLSLTLALGFFSFRRRGVLETQFSSMAIFVIGIVAIWRSVQPFFVPWSYTSGYFATHVRIDALLFGVLIAHVSVFRPHLWERLLAYPWLMIGVGLVVVTPPMFFDRPLVWIHTAGFTLLYLGYGSILLGAMGLQARSVPTRDRASNFAVRGLLAALAWIGVFSYGIYLWHLDFAMAPVWYHVQPKLSAFTPPSRWIVVNIIYICVAILAGVLMTYIIEFPVLRLRERWFPRPVDPVPAGGKR
jgi:peptidoglycan/LPS O-acetylase OafA/YrhL